MTMPLWAYQSVLALLAVLAGVLLWRVNRSAEHPWRFADMLCTHRGGKPVADRQAFMLLGGFFVLTAWGTYKLAAVRDMDEWFVLLYAAYCTGSYGYSRWLKSKGEASK